MESVTVPLPSDILDWIRREIAVGHYETPGELIRDALNRMKEEEASNQNRMKEALRLAEKLLPKIRQGILKPDETPDVIDMLREERTNELSRP